MRRVVALERGAVRGDDRGGVRADETRPERSRTSARTRGGGRGRGARGGLLRGVAILGRGRDGRGSGVGFEAETRTSRVLGTHGWGGDGEIWHVRPSGRERRTRWDGARAGRRERGDQGETVAADAERSDLDRFLRVLAPTLGVGVCGWHGQTVGRRSRRAAVDAHGSRV